jgi:hypothetical protein
MTFEENLSKAKEHVLSGGNLGPWFDERKDIEYKERMKIVNALWTDKSVLDAVWARKYGAIPVVNK